MRAAIYARYSSDNQRPESIDDQVRACRLLAEHRGFVVAASHVFTDEAKYLDDLREKTLWGQLGQKARGFTVGEATYGYRFAAGRRDAR